MLAALLRRLCLRLACGLAAGLASIGPAFAGWDYAEWGMSPEEIVEASGGKAVPHRVADRQPWGEYPALVAPHRALRMHFEAHFFFDSAGGGLASVRLRPMGDYWCVDMQPRLVARYGPPLGFREGGVIWDDPPSDSRITLYLGDGCSIRYEPLPASGD